MLRKLSREDLASSYRSSESPKGISPEPRPTPGTIRTHESTSEMYSDDFEDEGSMAHSNSQSASLSLDKLIKCFLCNKEIRASEAPVHTRTCRLQRMKSMERNPESSLSPRESISESLEESGSFFQKMRSPREIAEESKSRMTSTVIEEYSDDFEEESHV
jgi:hypothetical protein